MAELTTFSYRPGNSLIHSLDVRFKLAALVFSSLASLNADFPMLITASCLLVIVFFHLRMPLKSVLKEIRYFFLLMLLIFSARALTATGTPLFETKYILISRQGIYEGALVAWRLLIIVFLALPFVATTRSSEVKAAVEWYLTPFPFIPQKRIATMMSLIMRFIPVIFEQARETADAQRARSVENRKNPVYRMIKFAIPLIRRIFETADELVAAMEARCYSESRTKPEFEARLRDWMVLAASGGFCLWSVTA
jgi:energy-coupling factor transporter transmembrane protein EcfT